MAGTTYNGWANFETWVANRWIENDEASYEAAFDLVRETVAKASTFYDAEPDDSITRIPTRDQYVRQQVSDAIRDWCEEWAYPDLEGVAADLFRAAWSSIEWRELAEHWIEAVADQESHR